MSYDPRVSRLSPAAEFARILRYYRDEGFHFETAWAEAFWRVFYRWEGDEAEADAWADVLTKYRAIWPEQWHKPEGWSVLVVALERLARERIGA